MKITTNAVEFVAQRAALSPTEIPLSGLSNKNAFVDCDNRYPKLEVYTVVEVAALLHHTVPKSAIYQLINSGELHAKKVGNKYLIPKKAIEEFLNCREDKNQPGFGKEKMKTLGSSCTRESISGQESALSAAKKLKMLSSNI